ncbi:MAG: long-chain fatty acid--CoA ligase [Actinobacteria bacterium]|nr:MAG: long-chain fatty acid--CoA ligase [Actinomycetota bacterium]
MADSDFSDLVDLYTRSVERFAGNPLFGERNDDGTWLWMTYAEMGAAVDRARGGLASLGVGSGDRVAIVSDNRPQWAVGAYATYGLNAVWVPMYEAQQPNEWAYILGDCGARVVVVVDDAARALVDEHRGDLPHLEHIIVLFGEAGGDAITWDELLAMGASAPVAAVSPDEKQLAGLIYTSGTTGNPKGVMLSHGNIASNVSAVNEVFPIDPEDRSASFLPWAHSFGQTIELHTVVSVGASTGLTSAKTLTRDLPEIQPTILISVPTMFNRIHDGLNKMMEDKGGATKRIFDAAIRNERRREELAKRGKTTRFIETQHRMFDRLVFSKVRHGLGGRLKYAFSGGAAISTEVAEFISAVGITVYEGYGLTETAPVVTANVRRARKLGSVGRPIPGVTVKIDTGVSPEEGIGEIVVYGPNVLLGYYNLPEENERVFTADGGFRTGDLGSIDEDGYLFIRGRIKEQYKLENGKYVVPSPIEEKLNLSGYIAANMVYGDQRPYNVALIVADELAVRKWAEENGLDASEYQALLESPEMHELMRREVDRTQESVKGYERVRDFVLASDEWTPENGMLTPSLKVKRRTVLERYGERLDALYDD